MLSTTMDEENIEVNDEILSISSMEKFLNDELNMSAIHLNQSALLQQHSNELQSTIQTIRNTIQTSINSPTPRRNITEINRSQIESKKLIFETNEEEFINMKKEITSLRTIIEGQSRKIEELENGLAQSIKKFESIHCIKNGSSININSGSPHFDKRFKEINEKINELQHQRKSIEAELSSFRQETSSFSTTCSELKRMRFNEEKFSGENRERIISLETSISSQFSKDLQVEPTQFHETQVSY